MRTTTNFEEFMSYIDWDELDINEKRALLDAARSITNLDMGLFRTELQSELEDKTIVWYPLGEIGLILDIPARINFIKYIENTYMYGEDSDAYLSWLDAIQKEDAHSFIKETTIHMLPLEECRIVKKIGVAYKARKRIHFATIIYKRVLTEKYNFKNMNLDLQQDTQMYPHDELDDAIFEAVQELYPDATLSTETQMFDSEKNRQAILLRNQKKLIADLGIALEEEFALFHTTITKQIYPLRLNVYCLPVDATIIFSNMTFLYKTFDVDKYHRLVNLIANTLK